MGHRAQERARTPQEAKGSHPRPQHRLYPGAAMNERYKEAAKRPSRRTHDPDQTPHQGWAEVARTPRPIDPPASWLKNGSRPSPGRRFLGVAMDLERKVVAI